jgi:O-acetylserine/cysteine efflux transporter
MSLRDFLLFVGVCMLWGLNLVVSKVVIGQLGVPPLFYAGLRSAVIALAVCPWLLPMPRPRWRMAVVGLLMGGGGFALLFVGLETASPSSAAIVSQLGVPIATLLSVVVLGERIGWRRALGILLTFAGVIAVMWDPHGFAISTGLLFVAGSAFAGALGAVMMKQMAGIRPLRLQAWVGFTSMIVLLAFSSIAESNQFASAYRGGWPFLGMLLYSALLTSVVAHTVYYWLIMRYEANLIAPLTLMSPLFTIAFGIALTHDRFDPRMGFGTALALAGVLIIAVRPNRMRSSKRLVRSRA